MKKILYIIILLPLISCNGFLDEVDQDKLVPEKTDHYSALLLYEFSYLYPIFRSIDIMTDNMVENATALTTSKLGYKTTYTWQREIEIDEEGDERRLMNVAWQNMYEDIAIANYVIELIDDAMGTEEEISSVKGEAYFIRALSYFNLLNLYGQPYDANTANTELGVPLRDDIGIETTYSRNTVAEGYELIERDLIHARELMVAADLEQSIWHPTVEACDLLMSRVMLYQERWEEVIQYATRVIDAKKLSVMYTDRPFITADNSEVLYSYFTYNGLYGSDYSAYVVNPDLYNSYNDKDKRKTVFFTGTNDGTGKITYFTNKYQINSYTELGYANLRVAEAYLNRAEAYAKLGNSGAAIDDIQAIHATRYTNTDDVVYPTELTEVLAFVQEERNKELCFEDHHRWFDLRRMEDRPEIKHVFTLINSDGTKLGTETFTLLSNDINYTLPIPLTERENNPLIRNNERYEKIPEVDEVIVIP